MSNPGNMNNLSFNWWALTITSTGATSSTPSPASRQKASAYQFLGRYDPDFHQSDLRPMNAGVGFTSKPESHTLGIQYHSWRAGSFNRDLLVVPKEPRATAE